MPREHEDFSLLWDMLDGAKKIQQFVAGKVFHDYLGDEQLQAAVERKLEIIGEAARNVSQEFQAAHPEIPWRGIISQRHFLAHEYGEIRHEKLWRVATVRIPELVLLLANTLPSFPGSES